jgi:hypothetical protein
MAQSVIIEELTLTPIGDSQEIGIKPLRITVDGKPGPLIFNAHDIASIQQAITDYQRDEPDTAP